MLRLSSTALDRVSQGASIINLTAWFLWQHMVLYVIHESGLKDIVKIKIYFAKS